MDKNLLALKPALVWKHFAAIAAIPHPSYHEEAIRQYIVDFAAAKGIDHKVDDAGNVYLSKPATAGMEDRKGIVMQAHTDMVPQKNNDKVFDFEKDSIEAYIDGEWVTANGTTLGADNGIGMAAILAVMEDDTLVHGPIEALFTATEETGMEGAFGLKGDLLKGDILLNLDSEDEGEIFIGCAGGVRTDATFKYKEVAVPEDYFFFKVTVNNLLGGHSGDDINKGHANANKVLARFLLAAAEKYDMYLSYIEGGNKHNAIPREAMAVCAVPKKDKESVRVDFNVFAAEVEAEYAAIETKARFVLESTDAQSAAMDKDTMLHLLRALHGVFNGVFAMSNDVPGLVETSSNLASVRMAGGEVKIVLSQRSSAASGKKDVADTVRAVFELAGAEVEVGEGYPGWKPNAKSEILQIAIATYKQLFGKEPKVKAIHAGLECGLFLEKYPHLDMISFGPTMRGVHSPDERLLISTVELWWQHLVAVLEAAPVKG